MFILLWNRAPMIAVLLIQLALIYLYKVQRPHSRWLNYVKPQNIGNMMLKQLKKGSSSTHLLWKLLGESAKRQLPLLKDFQSPLRTLSGPGASERTQLLHLSLSLYYFAEG